MVLGVLDNRQKAFEAHFAYIEEMAFTVATYRNRLLALWAGDLMGLSGAALDAYAQTVVQQSLTARAALDPVQRICRDLMAKGFSFAPEDVRARMDEFGAKAAAERAAA
jgi:hypothetical protein